MKEYIKSAIVYILITVLVYFAWIRLELMFYGEIQTRKVDNIISLILIISLFINYKQKQFINILLKALVKTTLEKLSKESEDNNGNI